MAYKLYLKNDNTLTCTVAYKDTGAASTGASVDAIVVHRDSTGTEVETGLDLAQDDTDGEYEVLLDEAQYVRGVWYTAEVTVSSSDGVDGYIELDFIAKERRVS